MSKSTQGERVQSQAHRSQRRSAAEVSQAIDQIDTTLSRLHKRIIPLQPYLISVPSDVPYRYSSHFVNTWFIGTPFSAQEEQLQYLSFLPHQGEDESLLKVVGGWADEKGNVIEEEAVSPTSLSGRNTPIEQPNRKKISLKDYKTKDKTRPGTPTARAPAEELRKQVMKSEAKELVKVEEGAKTIASSNKSSVPTGRISNHKVEKSQTDGARSPQQLTESRRQDLPSPRKRRRLSSDSPKKEDVSVKIEKTLEGEDSKGLPLLLSPTLPVQQKERKRKALPGLLLPDLPPALEKLAAKLDNKTNADVSSASRTDPVKTILGNAFGSTAVKRPPEKTLNTSSESRQRSDSQTSTKLGVNTPTKALSPLVRPSLKTIARPITPLQNGTTASPKPRQRHVIVLRYGKKNRKRVEALIKFAPRPKKTKPASEESSNGQSETRPTSLKALPQLDKVDRKRPAEPSPERPPKKAKPLDTLEKSKLSTALIPKSPVRSAVAKPKPELATPKKELKSSAMRRIESQDNIGARTPQPDRARDSTPIAAAGSSQARASPGTSSLVSKEDRAGWEDMNTKHFALGRTLKHEGTSLGPPSNNDRNEKDQALAVVLLIEALLCFMLNHAALSQARPKIDPGWSTILPYHIFVFRASRKYRHLHGLVIQLGAICRQAIHSHDIDRLAREPLPFEHCDSAPTPGSDGNTKQNDDIEKQKRKYIAFRDQLVLNVKELQSAWLEGTRYLSPTLIEREYPRTWAKRTKDTSKRGFDKLKPDAISREYYLPLDINSSAFEATRFSLQFLQEWTDREKIAWKPRIQL